MEDGKVHQGVLIEVTITDLSRVVKVAMEEAVCILVVTRLPGIQEAVTGQRDAVVAVAPLTATGLPEVVTEGRDDEAVVPELLDSGCDLLRNSNTILCPLTLSTRSSWSVVAPYSLCNRPI